MTPKDNIPAPDPSTLTTDALAREVQHLTDLQTIRDRLTEERFEAFQKVLLAMESKYQQRYDAQVKAVDSAFLSSQIAVAKAEASAEKRLDSLVKFQEAFNVLASEQIPRKEAESRIEALNTTLTARLQDLNQKVDDLKLFAASSTGKFSGLHLGWILLVAAVGLVSTLIAVFRLR